MADMNEEDINARASKALDESVEALDASVLSRLNQARHAALEQRRSSTRVWWLPAVFASLAVVAVLLINDPLTSPITDTDVIVNNDDLELIEDMEFMTWLAEQQEAG